MMSTTSPLARCHHQCPIYRWVCRFQFDFGAVRCRRWWNACPQATSKSPRSSWNSRSEQTFATFASFQSTLQARETNGRWCRIHLRWAGCEDVDDALSCEKLENGNFRVGARLLDFRKRCIWFIYDAHWRNARHESEVHIADVTNFVKAGTPLDREVWIVFFLKSWQLISPGWFCFRRELNVPRQYTWWIAEWPLDIQTLGLSAKVCLLHPSLSRGHAAQVADHRYLLLAVWRKGHNICLSNLWLLHNSEWTWICCYVTYVVADIVDFVICFLFFLIFFAARIVFAFPRSLRWIQRQRSSALTSLRPGFCWTHVVCI